MNPVIKIAEIDEVKARIKSGNPNRSEKTVNANAQLFSQNHTRQQQLDRSHTIAMHTRQHRESVYFCHPDQIIQRSVSTSDYPAL
jgi:hypothetical protein